MGIISKSDIKQVLLLNCVTAYNLAICDCGGKLFQLGKIEATQCKICGIKIPNWECRWCKNNQIRIVSKGSAKMAEELAKAQLSGFEESLSKIGIKQRSQKLCECYFAHKLATARICGQGT